jgi:predicted ATPase/DNA-binding XRE family transcriptional regulator
MSRPAVVASTGGFAALLRAHRQAGGMTQEEFAAKAGVGVRTLRDLERGRARPQRATVELLAAALGLRGASREEFVESARRGTGGDPTRGNSGTVNLPPAPVLIGRDTELASLTAALRHAAMVTLVGVAGVGKTTLAWTAAHRVAARHPGGVAGVSVTEMSTGSHLLAAVASVFDVARASDLPARLAGGPSLLLVDGVEKSPETTVEMLVWLRANAPNLRVIATSRLPTGIAGEYVWPVGPLELPPPDATDLAKIAGYPAAELFLRRLREVGHPEVGPADAAAVAELVRRLGGLPLALELGAARGRVLRVREILDRYGARVLDLSGKTRAGQPITMREAIAGSYRLLEPAERLALRRLSQFQHRWSVELAEAMLVDPPPTAAGSPGPAGAAGSPGPAGAAGPDGSAGSDVVGLLDRLVGLGLVSVRGTGPVRFRLLDVVRDFAVEQSGVEGEQQASRHRHATVMAGYAARLAPKLVGATLRDAAWRLDYAGSDLHAALVWSAEHDPLTALSLAAQLPRWWRLRGHDREGRDWLRRLLDHPDTRTAPAKVRAWARLGLALLAMEHGDGMDELPELEASLAQFIRDADITGQLAARAQLCRLHQAYGNYTAAREHGEAALRLATRHGRTRDVLVAQNNLTWHEIRTGDLAAARRRLTAVQRLAAEVGEERLRALAHANLAEVARLDGRYPDAVTIGRRSLVLVAELGDPRHRWRVVSCIALALAQSNRLTEARKAMAEVGDPALVELIEAYLVLAEGDRAAAADRFAGAAAALTGKHDVRDVVEALVGLAASTDDPRRRERTLAELDELCERSAVSLLARERAALGR